MLNRLQPIIIIDDDEVNLTLLQFKLKQHLKEVDLHAFSNPVEALDYMKHHEADLVLVDHLMPKMTGIEIISQLRLTKNYKNIPIVMITSSQENSVRYEALEKGATDFLQKPVDTIELIAKSRNLLALRNAQRALEDRAGWLATEVEKATEIITAQERESLIMLGKAGEFRDKETGMHVLRVGRVSRLIAEYLGMDNEFCVTIEQAAPVHDVGKVGIPDAILLKPSRLTKEEFIIMQKHTLIGYEILKQNVSPNLQMGACIALNHHEKFDGSGYPNGKKGNEIPIEGRITALADVFDALASDRPYKTAWNLEKIKYYLKEESTKHFDPDCVNVFLKAWKDIIQIREDLKDTITF